MNQILQFILNLVGGLVDSFKQKNPVIFLVLAFAGLAAAGTIDTLINSSTTLEDGTVVNLISESLQQTLTLVRNGIILFLTAMGAHTPQKGGKK